MERYLQAAGLILAGVICNLLLRRQNGELAAVLTLGVCAMAVLVGLWYLEPITDLLNELGSLGNLDEDWMGILLKVVGIGLLGEVASLICQDAGEAALGKTLSMLSGLAILWLSVPMLIGLLTLIRQILEEL